jgi:hypothetical protein
VGYGHLYNEGIAKINGVTPRDMVDFVARIEATKDVVELETSSGGVIMLDAQETRDAQDRILQRYHIARDRSADLPGTVHKSV